MIRHSLVLLSLLLVIVQAADVWESDEGVLLKNGQRWKMKGLSWFGYETGLNIFHGLWANDYHFYFDFMRQNGFNALRIPFYLDLVLYDAMPGSITWYCPGYNGDCNKELKGKSSLQTLDIMVQTAEEYGVHIMFDMHSFENDAFMQNGLWYDSTHSEDQVIQGWDILISRYGNSSSVIGADLKNEPFQTTWATGDNRTDWDAASYRIGSHIAERTNWLIFIEGTAGSPPCSDGCFYGEDLQGVLTNPVKLTVPKRVVYSPHSYGPDVYNQPYFSAPNFPDNMPSIWDAHYGFIRDKNTEAIVVGEWGGRTTGKNGLWMNEFVSYLTKKDMTDQFFWCLNPDSGDTGGLLGYDWTTPDQAKLDLLTTLVPNPSPY